MLSKYQRNFAALSPDALALAAGAVARRHGIAVAPQTGEELFAACAEANIDHADVVMSLASDPTVLGLQTLETLVGKPVEVCRPARSPGRPVPVGQYAAAPRAREPVEKRPRAARPASSVSDPRVIAYVMPNPKRPGSASYDRYAKYVPGMTVDEAIAAGVTRDDIKWDSDPKRGFIKFEEK